MHRGTWKLDGSSPRLKVLKPVFGEAGKPWIEEEANWWIVDQGSGFAICGAADDRDPDSCDVFKRVR